MESDAALLLLEFDVKQGPVLSKCSKCINLTETQLQSVKCCAFPESAKVIVDTTHCFTFSVDNYLCYCLYVSKRDASAARGFHIFSYVIVDLRPLNNYCAYYRRILKNMGKYAEEYNADAVFEQIEGLLTVIANSEHSIDNDLIGIDLCKSLRTDDLEKRGRISDITRLWECGVLGEKVMVLGSTPKRASEACLAVASIIYPEQTPNFIPYLTVTDPRFQSLRNRCQIAGTSNPVVESVNQNFQIFRVGFDDKAGFGPDQKTPTPREKLTSDLLRADMVENTARLKCALSGALDEMIKADFLSVLIGKIDLDVLSNKISENSVRLTRSVRDFSSELIHSHVFERIRSEKLSSNATVKHLLEIDAAEACSVLNNTELCRICKGFMRAINSIGCDTDSARKMRKKLRIIRPNLIFPDKKCVNV